MGQGQVSGREEAKMTKGKEVSRQRAQEGGSLGLATIAVIGTWGQGAQWSSQTSTPGWGCGAGESVHVDPCLLKLVTARSFCNSPSRSAFSENGLMISHQHIALKPSGMVLVQGIRTHLPLTTALVNIIYMLYNKITVG